MTSTKCSDCKHWSPQDQYPVKRIGQCLNAIPLWEATEWDEDFDRVLKEQYVNQRIFAQDGSDYRAVLLTVENFYCADWKSKS